MIIIYYILAAVLIYLSYKSFRDGIDYLNYFKKEMAKPRSEYAPFVSVIAPCKGLDEGLTVNLTAVLDQDYPDYEVVFVVDDENDSSVGVIEEVSRKDAKTAKKAKIIVAPKAVDSSQKAENLREAVLHANDRSEAFVFVDSDARPAKDWLRHLVAPLENEHIGATTGYRWFISSKPTFASEMRSVWNASIASALGPNTRSNFCWGGSMAIRRDTFERLGIREKWRGTLSDDFTVTRAMNEAGLPIYFVPRALTATVENCTFHELLEFTTRQMKITRVYGPKFWLMSLFGSSLFNLVMIWSFALIIFRLQNDVAVWFAMTTLLSVAVSGTLKAWLRLKAARLVLRDHDKDLSRQNFSQNTLWVLAPALFFYNSMAAWASRTMTWRSVTYEMISPTETRIVNRIKADPT